MTEGSKQITTAQALEILGVNAKTLQRKKKDGLVQSWKVGRDWFFYEDEILALLPDVKKKQIIHAPSAIEKNVKKKKEVEEKAKEIEFKLKEAESKPSDELLEESGKLHLVALREQMEDLGIYQKIDDALIFSAALSFQTYLKYEALASSVDYMSVDMKGTEKEHPYSDVAKKHFDRYVSVCEKLGVTPLARNKLKPSNDKPKNDFEEFF